MHTPARIATLLRPTLLQTAPRLRPAVTLAALRRTLATTIPADMTPSDDPTLPQFVVGTRNGFLPRQDPLVQLPEQFAPLESLLQRMPLTREDGEKGLLWDGRFGDAVEKELPVLDVQGVEDSRTLMALFRDYTFAASAYLLEPCDIMNRKRGEYGLGRNRLPKNLAVPLSQVAAKIGARPFMEYAQSYALYNYKKKDSRGALEYDNLALIRSFSGMPSETGFILVHVAMVAHTGDQVKHTLAALSAVDRQDRAAFDQELKGLLTVLQRINATMDTMWNRSEPEDYNKFRTFIFGTKAQPMFPQGVVYEGVSDQSVFYRGESGANDSIVPSMDNLLQLTARMPVNPLTEILRDFRSYRPANHNAWLAWLEKRAHELNVREYAVQDSNSAVLYLALIDQIREFRGRHWNFTKEYIIKHTRHPVATGGSPITTWLPNQLAVVLSAMVAVGKTIQPERLTPYNRALAQELTARADAQARILEREVAGLKKLFVGQDVQSGDART
ncbi:hypothetical protein DFJ73DRAFT_852762 [Zopfochytrium polystomum]|nr:hypothetical protein DFJ73DRAFT_852762 [Zopfochytrium polystomum]